MSRKQTARAGHRQDDPLQLRVILTWSSDRPDYVRHYFRNGPQLGPASEENEAQDLTRELIEDLGGRFIEWSKAKHRLFE